jgi:hypothetical protein
MLATTLDVLRAALKSDPTITPTERASLLAVVRQGGQASRTKKDAASCPRILKPKVAAERLSCSVRTVHKLSNEGSLPKVRLPGRQRAAGFREEDINRLVTGRDAQ